MNGTNPEFIKCAMEAIEQGVKAADIKEECACRMGLMQAALDTPTIR
jgi:hypothetical protein